jgi:hypothetical protein
MNTQPFNPNPTKKLENMAKASNKINVAIAALDDAAKSSEHWTEWETLQAFKLQLEEFMSTDRGEAGFRAYIEKTETELQGNTTFTRSGRRIKVSIPED